MWHALSFVSSVWCTRRLAGLLMGRWMLLVGQAGPLPTGSACSGVCMGGVQHLPTWARYATTHSSKPFCDFSHTPSLSNPATTCRLLTCRWCCTQATSLTMAALTSCNQTSAITLFPQRLDLDYLAYLSISLALMCRRKCITAQRSAQLCCVVCHNLPWQPSQRLKTPSQKSFDKVGCLDLGG